MNFSGSPSQKTLSEARLSGGAMWGVMLLSVSSMNFSHSAISGISSIFSSGSAAGRNISQGTLPKAARVIRAAGFSCLRCASRASASSAETRSVLLMMRSVAASVWRMTALKRSSQSSKWTASITQILPAI